MNVENFRSVYSIRSYSGFKKAEIVVLYATGGAENAGHENAGPEIDGPMCGA